MSADQLFHLSMMSLGNVTWTTVIHRYNEPSWSKKVSLRQVVGECKYWSLNVCSDIFKVFKQVQHVSTLTAFVFYYDNLLKCFVKVQQD